MSIFEANIRLEVLRSLIKAIEFIIASLIVANGWLDFLLCQNYLES